MMPPHVLPPRPGVWEVRVTDSSSLTFLLPPPAPSPTSPVAPPGQKLCPRTHEPLVPPTSRTNDRLGRIYSIKRRSGPSPPRLLLHRRHPRSPTVATVSLYAMIGRALIAAMPPDAAAPPHLEHTRIKPRDPAQGNSLQTTSSSAGLPKVDEWFTKMHNEGGLIAAMNTIRSCIDGPPPPHREVWVGGCDTAVGETLT